MHKTLKMDLGNTLIPELISRDLFNYSKIDLAPKNVPMVFYAAVLAVKEMSKKDQYNGRPFIFYYGLNPEIDKIYIVKNRTLKIYKTYDDGMDESEYVNALESEEFMTYFRTILNNEFECTFTNVEIIKNVISTSVRYFVMISDALKVKQNVSKVKFSYVMYRSITDIVTVKKNPYWSERKH